MTVITGDKVYFPWVEQVQFEGPISKNPFAYKYYNPHEIVAEKSMEDHFRFAVAYWHTFCNTGGDPFGAPTKVFPWSEALHPIKRAKEKMDAGFEFITKMGIPYFCFHDVDLVDDAKDLSEFEKRLEVITDYAQEKMEASGVKVLWGYGQPVYAPPLHERSRHQP
jgi:xylose isomerase